MDQRWSEQVKKYHQVHFQAQVNQPSTPTERSGVGWGNYTTVHILSIMKEIIIEINITHTGKSFHSFHEMSVYCVLGNILGTQNSVVNMTMFLP